MRLISNARDLLAAFCEMALSGTRRTATDADRRLEAERDRYRELLEARPSTSFMSESTISQGYFLLHAYKPWDAKVAEVLGEKDGGEK